MDNNLEVSSDIFYQVKKQILDKLDIILQKVNLEIVQQKSREQFLYIELSTFQGQIASLFGYLDKLYQSLNSSISGYASYSSTKSHHYYQVINDENEKLSTENNILKRQIENLYEKLNDKTQIEEKCIKVVNECIELRKLSKQFKNYLKAYKFALLQDRVEIIAKLKQFSADLSNSQSKKEFQTGCAVNHNIEESAFILNEVNAILDLC